MAGGRGTEAAHGASGGPAAQRGDDLVLDDRGTIGVTPAAVDDQDAALAGGGRAGDEPLERLAGGGAIVAMQIDAGLRLDPASAQVAELPAADPVGAALDPVAVAIDGEGGARRRRASLAYPPGLADATPPLQRPRVAHCLEEQVLLGGGGVAIVRVAVAVVAMPRYYRHEIKCNG
jgi:hypothetical protein